MWPKGLRSLMMGPLRDTAGAGTDGGGTGTEDKGPKDNKLEIGGKKYDPKSVESALSLYEALQDEETGTEIITTLAKRAGLLDKDDNVKVKPNETKKQAESRVSKFLKNKLGKDYEKFADAIGPALDDALDDYFAEKMGNSRTESRQERWSAAVDNFTEEYEPSEDVQDRMRELIEESPFNWESKTAKPERYLERMYKQAEADIEEQSTVKRTSKKTSSRAKNRERDDESPDYVVRDAPKNVSLDDAIEAAMKGIKFRRS